MKKGDIITVVNQGSTFCSYQKWAERHNLTRWNYTDGYVSRKEEVLFLPNHEHLFKIVAIGIHTLPEDKRKLGLSNEILYGIEDLKTRQQFIIGEDGIEFVKNGEAQLEFSF